MSRPRPPRPRPAAPAVERPAHARTGAKLGWAVLAYVGWVVAVVTLEPFAFRMPAEVHVTLWATGGPWGGWFDVVANVAMFLPLGFIAALARSAGVREGGTPRVAWAWGAGAAVSAAIEIAQCFEPARVPSPTDVAANAAGAWLGAWLCRRTSARLRADSPLIGRLALELPIMGLVYVTLPLLTLAALTTSRGTAAGDARGVALAALGGFGGVLLGSVQRRQLGPAGATTAHAVAAAAAAWFAAGALPAAVTHPPAYAAGIMLAAAAAWLLGRGATPAVRTIERRFEAEALGRAAPWLAAYLALATLGDAGDQAWGQQLILRDLEHAAGFTVLGYVMAEAWGRREWRYRHSAWRVALAAAAAGLALAALAARTDAAGIGIGGIAVRIIAAAYGGWIYTLQRGHVQALVAARGRPDVRAAAGAPPAAARAA